MQDTHFAKIAWTVGDLDDLGQCAGWTAIESLLDGEKECSPS